MFKKFARLVQRALARRALSALSPKWARGALPYPFLSYRDPGTVSGLADAFLNWKKMQDGQLKCVLDSQSRVRFWQLAGVEGVFGEFSALAFAAVLGDAGLAKEAMERGDRLERPAKRGEADALLEWLAGKGEREALREQARSMSVGDLMARFCQALPARREFMEAVGAFGQRQGLAECLDAAGMPEGAACGKRARSGAL